MLSILQIILLVLNVAQFIIIIHIILSWLINFNVLSLGSPIVASIWDGINRLVEPVYRRIRQFLPDLGGIDLAPLVALLAIYAPSDHHHQQCSHVPLRALTRRRSSNRYSALTGSAPVRQRSWTLVAEGHDTLALMPTGGGKSLCFQLPALCRDGMTLVISPLIALMRDQVRGLQELGVAAGALTSGNTEAERDAVFDAIDRRALKLLYIAPERLASSGTIDLLRRARCTPDRGG